YFGVLIIVQLLASQNRYRIMAAISVINFVVKAIFNPIFAPIMGSAGIILATSVMYAMSYICYVFVALRPVPSSPSQALSICSIGITLSVSASSSHLMIVIHSLSGGGAERVAADMSA